MADSKFVYTVSGVELSEEHKAAISREIGAAVARVLVGAAPKAMRSEFLNIVKIHGGRWLPAELAAKQSVAEVVATSEG
jgi:hypothetical protein